MPDVSQRNERYAKREALHGDTGARPRRRGRPVKYSDASDVEGSDSQQMLLNAGDRRKRRRTDGGAMPSNLGDGWAMAEKSKWKSHREWSPPRATSYRRGERGAGAQNGGREKRAPPAGFMALSDVDWSSDNSGGAALDSNGLQRPPQRRSVLEPHVQQQQQQPRSMHEARSSASSENTDLVDMNGVGKAPAAAAVAVVKQQMPEQPQGPPPSDVLAAVKQDPVQVEALTAAPEPVVGV